jgi:ferritin-like metal-binding protein YciE
MKSTATRTKEKTLTDLYLDELADIYDVEKRLTKALPKMARAVSSLELKNAIEAHLQETEGHAQKLEQAFAEAGMKPKAKKCEAMVGILEEADEILDEYKGSQALDAAAISAAQKAEHYEIATYGCLREWATLLGKEEAAAIYEEILVEESACDEKLTEIARTIANESAEADEDMDEEEMDDEEADDESDDDDEPSAHRGRRSR